MAFFIAYKNLFFAIKSSKEWVGNKIKNLILAENEDEESSKE